MRFWRCVGLKRISILFCFVFLLFTLASCSDPPSQQTDNIPDQYVSLEYENADTMKKLIQSSNITPKMREEFFTAARKYCFEALPYFNEQEKPAFTSFMFYAYAMSSKEEQDDFRGRSVEAIAKKYFDISYDLKDDDIVNLPIGSLPDPLFAQLLGYSSEPLSDDTYKVTAVYLDRNAFRLFHMTSQEQESWEPPYKTPDEYYSFDNPAETDYAYQVMEQTGLTPFETVKHIIVSGDGEKIAYEKDNPNYKQQYTMVAYTSKDGITPEKFLSRTTAVF